MTTIINRKKPKTIQKELAQFDSHLEKHFEQIEDEIFDRQERESTLKGGKLDLEHHSIFGAIFQELKKRNKSKR